jgi:hypothetical protein
VAELAVAVLAVRVDADCAAAVWPGVIVETSAAIAAVSAAAPAATQRRARESRPSAASRSWAARALARTPGARDLLWFISDTIRQLHQLSLRAV